MVFIFWMLGGVVSLIISAATFEQGAFLDLEQAVLALGVATLLINFAVTFGISPLFLVFPMIATDRTGTWSGASPLLAGYGVRVRLLFAFSAMTFSAFTTVGSLRIRSNGGASVRFPMSSTNDPLAQLPEIICSFSGELLAAAFCATVFSLTYRRLNEISDQRDVTDSAPHP